MFSEVRKATELHQSFHFKIGVCSAHQTQQLDRNDSAFMTMLPMITMAASARRQDLISTISDSVLLNLELFQTERWSILGNYWFHTHLESAASVIQSGHRLSTPNIELTGNILDYRGQPGWEAIDDKMSYRRDTARVLVLTQIGIGQFREMQCGCPNLKLSPSTWMNK